MGADNKLADCRQLLDYLHSKFYTSVCETDAASYCAFVSLLRDGLACVCPMDGPAVYVRHSSSGSDVRCDTASVDSGVCLSAKVGLDVDCVVDAGNRDRVASDCVASVASVRRTVRDPCVSISDTDSVSGDTPRCDSGSGGEGELRLRGGLQPVLTPGLIDQSRLQSGRGKNWERNEVWRKKRRAKRSRRLALLADNRNGCGRGSTERANCRAGVEADNQEFAGCGSRGRGLSGPANRSYSNGTSEQVTRNSFSMQLWEAFTPEQKRMVVDSRVRKMVNENVLASAIARKSMGKTTVLTPVRDA